MPDQYRRESEREPRGWRDTERRTERFEDRPQRGGDWRGGSGRWPRSESDERGYATSDRGGISRETGFDRGTSRDERNSRDWQQRVTEDDQGYRSQEQWRGSEEPWHRSHEHWRGSHEYGAPDRGARERGYERERDQERFGTGGSREREQDWGHERSDRETGSPWARHEEQWRDERGREGGRGPGGGWPWGGGGGPMTWGIGGSESPRGIGGTREGAWPGHSGRGPKGYRRSDERIREDVSDRLMDDHHVDASDITVEVKDGEVTLSGTVPDRQQKRRAEELVERVNGVTDVHITLRVNRQAGGQAWQTAGEPGSQQVGQQVPIGGQQSWEGIRAGHDQSSAAGQQATQAGQGTQSAQKGSPPQPTRSDTSSSKSGRTQQGTNS